MNVLAKVVLSLGVVYAACSDQQVTNSGVYHDAETGTARRVVVTPNDMGGWSLRAGGSSSASLASRIHAPPNLGTRSVHFTVGSQRGDDFSLRFKDIAGVKLADLSALTYRLFIAESDKPEAGPFMILPVDVNGDDFIDDHLVFRPAAGLQTWQRWDALGGQWWSTSVIGNPDERGFRSLRSYLTDAPDARIASSLIVGYWHSGDSQRIAGSIDGIAIGVKGKTVVYDFEQR